MTDHDLDAIATRFLAAHRDATLMRDPPSLGIDEAYAVADRIYRARGAKGERGVGRKIGFTNPRMWAQYGASGPLWGHVYDRTLRNVEGEARFALAGAPQVKIEPEIVFRLREVPREECSVADVLDCIDWVAHGFEMVASHIEDWRFTPPQAAADFGLHVALLVGPRVPIADIADAEPALRDFEIELLCNGEVRDRGTGASVLGHPLNAIVFLVNALADAPHLPQLRPGEVITTGTLTAALPVSAGETWSTRIKGIGLAELTVTME